MKKEIRIFLSLALALCLLGGNISQAYAAGIVEETDYTQIEPRYVHIMGTTATINVNSSTGKITSSMTAVSSVTSDTLKVTMSLQKLENGDWEDVKTWDTSSQHSISYSKPYYVYERGTYRVYVVIEVYNSSNNLVERVTAKSAEKTY